MNELNDNLEQELENIKQLEIGQSMSVNASRRDLEHELKSVDGFFDVVYADKTVSVVLRLASEKKSIAERVTDEIESLTIFQEKEIHGDLGYVRSLVSKFNSANGRKVKVVKRGSKIMITEDFMNRESITSAEYETLCVRLEEIRETFEKRCDDYVEFEDSDELIDD